jgi:hypothetical protein
LGADVRAVRVLIENNRSLGGYSVGTDAILRLEDALVLGTNSEERGYGVGIGAMADSRVDASRLTVIGSFGAALMAVPSYSDTGAPAAANAVFAGADVFVRNVGPGTVRVTTDEQRAGGHVAYGIHAARNCTANATRIVIDESGFGFFNLGTMRLEQGVISRQLTGFGARSDLATRMVEIVDVASVQNAIASTIVDGTLPEGSSLSAPSPVCPIEGCQ